MDEHPDRSRERALALLETFRQRILPSGARRLAVWRGLSAQAAQQFLEDALQELRVDCLEHAATVLAMPERQRHERWFRLLSSHSYRSIVRPRRRFEPADLAVHPGEERFDAGIDVLELPPPDAALLRRLANAAHYLKNGRINLEATARAAGVAPAQARRLWSLVARRAGYGSDYLERWRRWLTEALARLAIAALATQGTLRTLRPVRVERAVELRRLDRARRALEVLPTSRSLRSGLALAGSLLQKHAPPCDPLATLTIAADLEPRDGRILLWCFEAAVSRADFAAAAAALRRVPRAEFAVSLVLARARLLEARGRCPAATALLDRALPRHGGDPRLAASLAALLRPSTARKSAPSARRISVAISRSKPA